jgi:hypothetical protein
MSARLKWGPTILRLAQRYVQSWHSWEATHHATIWTRPWRVVGRSWQLAWLNSRRSRSLEQLVRAYQTVVFAFFNRSGLPPVEWGRARDLLAEHLGTQVFRIADFREVATLLWSGVCGAIPASRQDRRYKPKFMLRQFIDELDSPSHRTTLLSLAYSDDRTHIGENAAADVDAAYRDLHGVLSRHAADLPTLTDGAITGEWLTSVDCRNVDSLRRFDALLFPE